MRRLGGKNPDGRYQKITMLGFCADAHGPASLIVIEYREQLEIESAISKAEDREREIESQRSELIESVSRNPKPQGIQKRQPRPKRSARQFCTPLSAKKMISVLRDIAENGNWPAVARETEKTNQRGTAMSNDHTLAEEYYEHY